MKIFMLVDDIYYRITAADIFDLDSFFVNLKLCAFFEKLSKCSSKASVCYSAQIQLVGIHYHTGLQKVTSSYALKICHFV